MQLARRHDVPLRLTTLVVRDSQMYPSEVGYDAERLVEEQWRMQASEAQEKALAQVPDDVEVEAGVVGGRDWEDALDSLGWEEGEVLVVGSSRLGPVARLFLGSNSTKIVRSSPVPRARHTPRRRRTPGGRRTHRLTTRNVPLRRYPAAG